MTWKQGTIAGPASLVNGRAGTLHVEGPFGKALNTALVNFGTVRQLRHVTLNDGALIENQRDATYLLTGGDLRSNGGEVLNSGEIKKPRDEVGVGESVIRAPLGLADGGVLQTDNGKITLTGGGSATGLGNRIVASESFGSDILLEGEPFHISGGDPALALEGNGLIECRTELVIDTSAAVVSRVPGFANAAVEIGPGGVVRGGGTFKNELFVRWMGGSIGRDAAVINDRNAFMRNPSPLSIDGGSLINFGAFVVDADITIIGDGIFVNRGEFETTHSATVRIFTVTGLFSNENKVAVRGPNGRLVFTGPVGQLVVDPGPPVRGKLIFGEWVADPGSWIEFASVVGEIGPGASVVSGSPLTGWALDTVRGSFNVNGHITGPRDLDNRGNINVEEAGSLEIDGDLNNNSVDEVDGVTEDFAPLAAATAAAGPVGGYIADNFNNHGIVLPGGTGASGPFRVTGNFNQSVSGLLEIELGGTTPFLEHDQLTVQGHVNRAGTVKIIPLKGFLPQVGQSFDIVTATGGVISAQFDQVVGPGQCDITNGTEVVTASVVALPGDSDLDEDLDLVDYGDFAACLSGPGGTVAPGCDTFDLNANGSIDLGDGCAVQLVFGGPVP